METHVTFSLAPPHTNTHTCTWIHCVIFSSDLSWLNEIGDVSLNKMNLQCVKCSVLTIFLGTKTHTHTPDLTATSTEYFFDIRKCLNACTRLIEWIALICVKRFSSSFYMRIVVHCVQKEKKFKDTNKKRRINEIPIQLENTKICIEWIEKEIAQFGVCFVLFYCTIDCYKNC